MTCCSPVTALRRTYLLLLAFVLPFLSQGQDSTDVSNQHSVASHTTVAMLMGLKADQQASLRDYLKKSPGIESSTDLAAIPTGLELKLTNTLSTESLIKIVKAWNPSLYYMVNAATEGAVVILISKTPFTRTKDKSPAAPESPTPQENTIQQAPISAAPEKDEEKIFTKVYVEPRFHGGPDAYTQFLTDNLDVAKFKMNGAPNGTYKVLLRFIVWKDGHLSDIEAMTKPGYGIESEVIRVFKKSPNWDPGQMSGPVNCYHDQPITVVVE